MSITFTIPYAFLCTIFAELRHQPYHVVVGGMRRHIYSPAATQRSKSVVETIYTRWRSTCGMWTAGRTRRSIRHAW
jgi:hypothetical protein